MRQHAVFALGAALLAAAGVLGIPAPGAAASPPPASGYRAPSPDYGLSVFAFGHPDTTARDLDKIGALGFGWQKSTFEWRAIEGACKGCFAWEEADRVVRASAEAGLKVVARLDFQPSWARKDGAANGPPDRYQDYADFVQAVVSRYRAGSGHGTVQAIQVWNEPNIDREWGGRRIDRGAAAEYARLLSVAYKAAKRADPNVTVITAGLSPTGVSSDAAQPDDVYLRWLYEAGLRGNFDALGANANVQCPCVGADPGAVAGFDHPSFYFRRVEQLREIMVANGDAGKQVWLMEFGWTTDRVHPAYAWYATTEAKKAELIVQAFRFAAERWAPWIGVMALWTIADPSWGAKDEQVWWAITNPDGTTRPAYDRLLRARAAGELPRLDPAKTPAAASPRRNRTPATASAPPAEAVEAAPTGEAVPGEPVRVAGTDGASLNLRAAPSLGAARIKGLTPGIILLAIGGVQVSEGREWRHVRDPEGAEGWAAAEFLEPA